ncbi:MAG: DUF432 domain-containing protein [Methanocorpusculum sp.]|nr:DUF432 domain-containing protein [Methanocorpusculum sp.]
MASSIIDTRRKRASFCYDRIGPAGETIAFGTYPFSRCIQHRKLSLSFEDDGGIIRYHRLFAGKTIEANIASGNREYTIMPSAPLHLPKPVTDFLQIRFDEIAIEPGAKTVIFVTAPLEIAVTLKAENAAAKTLDVFSFAKPKFALYGTATRGVITRFIRSPVSSVPVPVKNYKEFLLRLEIENTADTWASIGRVILFMKGLSLYWDSASVAACASVSIINTETAVVTCEDTPLRKDMTRAETLYRSRRVDEFCNVKGVVSENTFTMDMGLK